MPEWGRLNRGTPKEVPHRPRDEPSRGGKLDVPQTFGRLIGRGRLPPAAPTLKSVPWPGVAADASRGRGKSMTDVFAEVHDAELTEEDLDVLEALGAAEDADRILGEIDA